MNEERLYEQLVQLCQSTVQKIEENRQRTCRPKMFLSHSDAAQCNLQENIDFDQDMIIENAIKRWAHLALTHIHTGTDIHLQEFLGMYIEITEEVPVHDKEVTVLRTALLEVLHLYNENTLTFPVACKLLIAGLQETAYQQYHINPGRMEITEILKKLLHATSQITVQYRKANINFKV